MYKHKKVLEAHGYKRVIDWNAIFGTIVAVIFWSFVAMVIIANL